MDGELLKSLYQAYHGEICLYLYSLCGDRGLAEDLTQDTFLKALLSLDACHTNMRAWLYRVARNLYFNHRKRMGRMESREDLPPAPSETADLPTGLIQAEQRKMLYRALQRLDRRKREILQLQYFGGLSQAEIAGILGLSPGNVRVLALRAKRELKQILEEDGYDIS